VLLNYHSGCIVLGLPCVGVRLRFDWGGIRANMIVQQHSRKLMKIDTLVPEHVEHLRSKI